MNSPCDKSRESPPPVRAPLPPGLVAAEARGLARHARHLLLARGAFQVLWFRKADAPALFHELTRQRELTFRAAGQGTGLAFDETPEDTWYDQIVLWDVENGRVAGAYRAGSTTEVLSARGTGGLYLSHMFEFDPVFFERLGPALELSRSFVIPELQGDGVALGLLWQGLGRWLARRPETRGFFGSVTISARYSESSRDLLVAWLARHHAREGKSLARARVPYPVSEVAADEAAGFPAHQPGALRRRITDAEGVPMAMPPLIRHYLSLGAVFHAFHREAGFGDAIYCLLEVDVGQMPAAHWRRFVGREKENSASFGDGT